MTYNVNFDSFPNSMIAFFILATKEGWVDIMLHAVDANGQGVGPSLNTAPIAAYFFVIYVFLSSFFLMNMFIGIIYMNFEAAQREEKESSFLKDSELKWMDMLKMIVKTKPDMMKTPNNKVSKWLFEKTKAETKFDFVIMACIILNMLSMAVQYES
jgi:voltage-dependent calcium channel L type alpha-1D